MKHYLYLTAIAAVFSSSCLRAENIVSVKSETSFGECVGYCQTELIITESTITFTAYSTDKSAPKKRITQAMSKNEWLQLTQNAPLKLFFTLPDIIGDPDDADQGTEILEIKTETRDKKSSFDYNAKISGMERYLQIIRKIRNEMGQKLSLINH